MANPYEFEATGPTVLCPDLEQCDDLHTDTETDGTPHHYGCECGDCIYYYWRLKS